jgi:probable F420-dependent oxidoreductase
VISRPFRFGVVTAQAQSGEAWVAKARRIEQLGYSTLLMPDRLGGPLFSPLPALAVAASATRSLRVGTFVLATGLRNPLLLARECATLDFLSGGRFELGLGAGVGEEDFRQAGLPFDPPGARVDRLAETLAIVKALFAGQEVNFSGAHHVITGARGYPPPIHPPHPPILVAGAGQRMLALAAREADIIALGVRPPAGDAELAEKVELLRREAGDRFDQVELSFNLVAVVGEAPLPASVGQRLRFMMKLDLDQLVQAKSPFVLTGTGDQMCEQLLERRERLGFSYVTVPDDLFELFAPVVERLAGH